MISLVSDSSIDSEDLIDFKIKLRGALEPKVIELRNRRDTLNLNEANIRRDVLIYETKVTKRECPDD